MALTTKRIIALPSQTDPQEGDYLAIDNATSGTHKIPVGRIGVEVDDTLTEAGKAADAKATGDAIDELRTQLEVTGTASGAIATFADGSDAPMKSCIATIVPKQSGSGTPSPENVRQISGWESVSVNVMGKNLCNLSDLFGGLTYWYTINDDGTLTVITSDGGGWTTKPFLTLKAGTYTFSRSNAAGRVVVRYSTDDYAADVPLMSNGMASRTVTFSQETSIKMKLGLDATAPSPFTTTLQIETGSTATDYEPYQRQTITKALGRTVYGGTLDVVTGVLTAYPFYPSYNGETLDGRWICDRAVYAEGTTPPTGSQVALISGTSTTYQLTPTEIQTLLGENNVWADSGDVEVVYVRDLNIAINNLLNSNGTRSLGMMAMSAPTEATADEPTDEQTDEPAEDDMR